VTTFGAFEKYFRVISYLVALCGLAALYVSGAIGIASFAVFILVFLLAWKVEGTRWQISERIAVGLILIAIPVFILDWRFKLSGIGVGDILAASSLAKLILFLSAVKLLQRKSDRDWIFIYLIAFFQLLLAAGVSISPFYLVSLLAYLLLTASAIIAFEIRKTSREVRRTRDKNLGREIGAEQSEGIRISRIRLPVTAVSLIIATTALAVPLFFALPRVGGAGITSGFNEATRITGFSDSVTLGAIGRLQQSNEIVMRVRIDRNDNPSLDRYRWRGVALDQFHSSTWSRSNRRYREPFAKTSGDRFIVDFARSDGLLTVQTVYLEPLNSSVMFAMPRPIVIRSGASEIAKDSEGGFSMHPAAFERVSYTVYSDTFVPPPNQLRRDNSSYPRSAFRYLNVPSNLDSRIGRLASSWIEQERASTRYDIAKAVERHLQNDFGYTLDLRAGGQDPLSDFLFNVREGHCEYFATAMAIMLRTQGIATRVVNGFQQGEYNDTAGVYVVRQQNAHSWVEVYFPGERIWVPFDPTPFAGQNLESGSGTMFGRISKYLEALETFWIQYFVSYDDQEQRSLFRSFRDGATQYRDTGASWASAIQGRFMEWWSRLRGDEGMVSSAKALGIALGGLFGIAGLVLILRWLWRKIAKLAVWGRIADWLSRRQVVTTVGFFARLQDILEARGFTRTPDQTPLEFAYASGFNEAVKVTEKYNAVRFGEMKLRKDESDDIENWLKALETTKER